MDGLVCDNCATPLPKGSKYCSECGTPVPGQGAAASYTGHPTDLRQALMMATAGEYEIHHELGRGGMGSVFLAREIGLDRLVAIKVLPPSLMFDEGLIERFKREARMVAKLHHPNIIPVYRVHHSHNLAFYTMHFVPGRSLAEIIGQGRVPALAEVERILLEAAAGLGYAHKRGVIHRDVKPANVLVDAEGHVHLTDFGIAKALVGSTQLTETGAVIGTPQYMAPEQCEGRMVDGRADQYSLAAVGYQLLTGQPPFVSDSMKELLYHHMFTPPRPINAVRPETPMPLRDAVHKALSKDPADRFDSMEDFRLAVEGKGPPVYVSWLESAEVAVERRGRTPPAGPHPFRRVTDPPTTERLPDAPWATRTGEGEELWAATVGGHRRAMGVLAAAVVTIGVVTVLALTKGAGVAGSWRGAAGSDGEQVQAANLAAAEGAPSGAEEPAANPAPGRLLIEGNLPAGARVEVDGQAANAEGGAIELPAGTRHVVISATGFKPFAQDVTVEAGKEIRLAAALEAVPAPPPADDRPPVPRSLIRELDVLLQQGQVLHEMGRYVEAVDAFNEAELRAEGEVGRYRDAATLRSIAATARDRIEKARTACKLERQRDCP